MIGLPVSLLAKGAHQVLARWLLTVRSMQKSQARSAALPDSRTRSSLGRHGTCSTQLLTAKSGGLDGSRRETGAPR